jgi:C4-type Zn-finger protein
MLLEALAEAQIEQEKLFASTKKEKSLEKKAEIAKKDKDITIIIDDEESKEKLKDKFMEAYFPLLSIWMALRNFIYKTMNNNVQIIPGFLQNI